MYETLKIFTIISDYVKEIPFIEETDEENAILVIYFYNPNDEIKILPISEFDTVEYNPYIKFFLKAVKPGKSFFDWYNSLIKSNYAIFNKNATKIIEKKIKK